jgi:hypothetical protein
MKTALTSFLLIMLFVSTGFPLRMESFGQVPDVMNNLNLLVNDGNGSRTIAFNLDSFPTFSGYPVTASGSTFEGGIFCNMDADSDFELVYNVGFTVQVRNLDGTSVPGWPQTVSSYPLEGAPAFGDIDNDGQGEIVVTNHGTTSGGFIYAFRRNGTIVTGFPINHGYSSRTPVLADLNNDGALEIIVNKRLYPVGEVWIYRGNTTVYPGWPKSINHVPASSSAVGDVTGDGIPEIVSESYSSLYTWDRDGNSLPGFPFTMPNGDVNSYSSPVLADLDNDNIREIVFGTHVLGGGGYVYCLENNATIMSGWPKPSAYWIYGPPAVGFIDNDNILDIAYADQVLSGSPADFVFAYNKNGVSLSGFPIGPLWAINSQILLADIDNDNMTELIFDDNTTISGMGKYLAYNHNGTPVSGWPIATQGTTFFSTPVLCDINNNGILDIAGSGTLSQSTTYIYLWNTGINYNIQRLFVPMWQYNTRHNGVYGDILVAVEPVNSKIPASFKLFQNYPNPFNPATTIKVDIPGNNVTLNGVKNPLVSLKIFDILGREITTLIRSELPPGTYEFKWDASYYPSGIYFCKLTYVSGGLKIKMILLK